MRNVSNYSLPFLCTRGCRKVIILSHLSKMSVILSPQLERVTFYIFKSANLQETCAYCWVCFRSLTELWQRKVLDFQVLNSGPSGNFSSCKRRILQRKSMSTLRGYFVACDRHTKLWTGVPIPLWRFWDPSCNTVHGLHLADRRISANRIAETLEISRG